MYFDVPEVRVSLLFTLVFFDDGDVSFFGPAEDA
jgi:hypothetical protein